MRSRVAIVASAIGTISLSLLFLLTDPLPQDPAYFAFADQRSIFGVPNFMAVSSNLLFLLTGLWGLWVASRTDDQRLSWLILTLGGYALAKLFEFFDTEIYAATALVSGHTLKHIAAACAAFVLLQAIRRSARSPRSFP